MRYVVVFYNIQPMKEGKPNLPQVTMEVNAPNIEAMRSIIHDRAFAYIEEQDKCPVKSFNYYYTEYEK